MNQYHPVVEAVAGNTAQAYLCGAYNMAEIVDFSMHYMTVSQAIRAPEA